MRLAKIGFPRAVLKELTYIIPAHLPPLEPGMRVIVPLSRRFAVGFVLELDVESEPGIELKEIADLVDPKNLFPPVMLKLTKWMADYYLAEWPDILRSALPPALDIKPETLVRITANAVLTGESDPVLQFVREKETVPLKKVYDTFGYAGTYSKLRGFQERGLIIFTGKQKGQRFRGSNMVEVIRASEAPIKGTEKEIYEYLRLSESPVSIEQLKSQFPTCPRYLRKMEQGGQIRRFWLPSLPRHVWPELRLVTTLTDAQEKAVDAVRPHLNSFQPFLLHGVTGSGKTEVYLRVAADVLKGGKTVLVLVPEIALLPLVARRVEKVLPYALSIQHSELSDRERLLEWEKAKKGEVRVVIGTRSALFSPLPDLGLIVIDEEQDGAYKQGEYPRYHARESAIIRAQFENCPIILGSATPSLESFWNAETGKYKYLSLPSRVESRSLPQIKLMDMKEEFRKTGDAIFSAVLLDELEARLSKKEQSLVLQNRRGYASLLVCRDCGNVLTCPHCSVTLTFHKAVRRMRCHYCDYSRLAPRQCEKCKSQFLHLFGAGTEKIVEALKRKFPEASIERFDRDATKEKGSIPRILSRFAMKEIDILVGTQMLAKGHDFPDVTLVGIIGADTSIGIPDFRASEKLFQLITQVAGRSGRGTEPGFVILQTYHPEHYAIRSSIEQNYSAFYEREIKFRKFMQYPPFVALANLIFSGKVEGEVLDDARSFAKLLLAFKTDNMKILGPAIAPVARIGGLHRFQLLVKSPARKTLKTVLRQSIDHYRKAEKKTLVAIDIDPYSIS